MHLQGNRRESPENTVRELESVQENAFTTAFTAPEVQFRFVTRKCSKILFEKRVGYFLNRIFELIALYALENFVVVFLLEIHV